ncbi:uncharacterized protein LOC133181178 [Saccostrea echinata]|uniref:uncharacterized protein LOC133181178 n=1 Tax=Saccostrea echinata TaxID=191078 RepID=UPI002A820791|nr:uncharacterized protein LOC133181178 [Saccostrea echinata]
MMAAFGSQFVTAVLSYGVGVLHNAFLSEFKGNLTITALVGSIFASLLSLLGPIVSFVINKWSCRVAGIISGICLFSGLTLSVFAPNLITLIFTFGIVAGSGLGFSAITAVIVVGYSFEKYRGLAVGLNVAGAGLGMLAGGPLIQFLIDQYGLRGALLILGAFGSHNVVFGALMRPTEIEMSYKNKGKTLPEKRSSMCNFRCDILKKKSFLCILISAFLWNIPYAILYLYLPRFSVVNGATEMEAASLITMLGLGSTLNRLLAGLILGPGGIDPLLLNFGFLGIFGLTTVTFPFYCTNYIGQNIYAFISGIYSGGLIVLINPLCLEIVGISQLSTAVGVYFTWAGIGCILAGPFAGLLIENGITYKGVFFLSGAMCLLGAFSTLCASLWYNTIKPEEKAASFVDFKESRFLSGSAYFSGSFTVIVDAENRQKLKKSSESVAKTSNCNPSMESLFMDTHSLHAVRNPQIADRASTLILENFTPKSKRKWLTRPGQSMDQSQEGLQIQEIRLLHIDESGKISTDNKSMEIKMADKEYPDSTLIKSKHEEKTNRDSFINHEKIFSSDVDRGWAFVVLAASFFSMFVAAILTYGTGVIHVGLLEKFQKDAAFTSLIGSVFLSLLSLMGPAVSFVVNRWSCRVGTILGGLLVCIGISSSFFVERLSVLIVTYGVIAGSGMSFIVLAPVIVIGYAFEKYRGMAVGFAVMGAGFGMFVSGPLTQFLLDTFGLQGAFLILGGIGLQCVFLGSLMKPAQLEKKHKIDIRRARLTKHEETQPSSKCKLNCELLHNKTFILIVLSAFLWNAAYSIISVNLSNYAYSKGATKQEAAFLWTMVGIGSTVNRFLAGLTLGPNGIDPLLLDFGFLGIIGILTLTFPLYANLFSGQCIFSLFYGIYSGGLVVLINPLCLELVGLQQLPLAVGFTYFSGGVGSIIGPPFTGLLVDAMSDYSFAFYQTGGLFLLAALLVLISSLWRSENEFLTAVSLVSLNSARLLSGSAFISGSLSLIVDPMNIARADSDSIYSHQSFRRALDISSDNVAKILLERKYQGRDRTVSENDAQFTNKYRNSPIVFNKRTVSVDLGGDKSKERVNSSENGSVL